MADIYFYFNREMAAGNILLLLNSSNSPLKSQCNQKYDGINKNLFTFALELPDTDAKVFFVLDAGEPFPILKIINRKKELSHTEKLALGILMTYLIDNKIEFEINSDINISFGDVHWGDYHSGASYINLPAPPPRNPKKFTIKGTYKKLNLDYSRGGSTEWVKPHAVVICNGKLKKIEISKDHKWVLPPEDIVGGKTKNK